MYNYSDEQEERVFKRVQGAYLETKLRGLYCVEISRLIKSGQIENYHLSNAVVGLSSTVDYSQYSERISYLKNFKTLCMLPFPHRNLINFIGMGEKKDYLIWIKCFYFFYSFCCTWVPTSHNNKTFILIFFLF